MQKNYICIQVLSYITQNFQTHETNDSVHFHEFLSILNNSLFLLHHITLEYPSLQS